MASACAATINYPLWRASAVGQSGFRVTTIHLAGMTVPPSLSPYLYAFWPPYKGLTATVLGMTWARAAIFWGSDRGKDLLRTHVPQCPDAATTVLPPLVVSTLVQCINMPIVRASITLQDPQSDTPNIRAAVRHIYQQHGLRGLWHGTSAGILKTVPKYCTAVVVKDWMETTLMPPLDHDTATPSDRLWRSAYKSAAAGIAGAALTNPLDVIRNEMFKTNQSLVETVRSLHRELGYSFLTRGMGKNLVAVAIPVGCTIFFTDAFIQFSERRKHNEEI